MEANKDSVFHIKDLAARYGVAERTIYNYHADGTIPKARYLPGKRWPFWLRTDIEANERPEKRSVKLTKAIVKRATPRATPRATQPPLL